MTQDAGLVEKCVRNHVRPFGRARGPDSFIGEDERFFDLAPGRERARQRAAPEDLGQDVGLARFLSGGGCVGRRFVGTPQFDERVCELPGDGAREAEKPGRPERVVARSQRLFRARRIPGKQLRAADVLPPRRPQHHALALSVCDLPHAVECMPRRVDVAGLGKQIGVTAEDDGLGCRVVTGDLQKCGGRGERLGDRRRPPGQVHCLHSQATGLPFAARGGR